MGGATAARRGAALVPIGGMVGGLIGVIDGDKIGQIVGGQIGGKSMAFWQRGCICPLTHCQMHSALAAFAKSAAAATRAVPKIAFIGISPSQSGS